MPIDHIRAFYEALTSLYTDASAIGFPVAHIAEFYLERWWQVWPVVIVLATTEYPDVSPCPVGEAHTRQSP